MRLRRNRARIVRAGLELGMWVLLAVLLVGWAGALWRVAQAYLLARPLPWRLAFPAVAAACLIFCGIRAWGAWRQLQGLRAEQRWLATQASGEPGPGAP